MLKEALDSILSGYVDARNTSSFSATHPIVAFFASIEERLKDELSSSHSILLRRSCGQGNWAHIPWIAILDTRETDRIQSGLYCVFLFREDMSGVYLTLAQGVTDLKKQEGNSRAREILKVNAARLRDGFRGLETYDFRLDDGIDLHSNGDLAVSYEQSVISYKLYETGKVPSDSEIKNDIKLLIAAYVDYVTRKGRSAPYVPAHQNNMDNLLRNIKASGFHFEPWQVASFVTALRTKPFVILAGVTGTGKSKLPKLVAEATGSKCTITPVRPDWTDSSDILGYCNLNGDFVPGSLIEVSKAASEDPSCYHICIIDEMNLARVEHYFAEVLSLIEDREKNSFGGYISKSLYQHKLKDEDKVWNNQRLTPNLAIVGTVNMDESTHGFSKKVLDRAFTIELSDVNLTTWKTMASEAIDSQSWPVEQWYPRAIRLGELTDLSSDEEELIDDTISTLTTINNILTQAQLQIGYRTRDEIALFMLNTREISEHFITSKGDSVDPLDLAIMMKILPRISGGSIVIKQVLQRMLGWVDSGVMNISENNADNIVSRWNSTGRLSSLQGAVFPRAAARLCLMWDRLSSEGFTSYWL